MLSPEEAERITASMASDAEVYLRTLVQGLNMTEQG